MRNKENRLGNIIRTGVLLAGGLVSGLSGLAGISGCAYRQEAREEVRQELAEKGIDLQKYDELEREIYEFVKRTAERNRREFKVDSYNSVYYDGTLEDKSFIFPDIEVEGTVIILEDDNTMVRKYDEPGDLIFDWKNTFIFTKKGFFIMQEVNKEKGLQDEVFIAYYKEKGNWKKGYFFLREDLSFFGDDPNRPTTPPTPIFSRNAKPGEIRKYMTLKEILERKFPYRYDSPGSFYGSCFSIKSKDINFNILK